MFRGIGLPEILIILAVLALIFGASRLPQIGNSLGRSIREFKKGVSEPTAEEQPKVQRTAAKSDTTHPVQH